MFYKPDPEGYKEIVSGVFMKPLAYGDKEMLCEFRLNQGAVIPSHHHPHEQAGYLVSGSVRLFGEDGELIASPGYGWNFKGGVAHGAEALVDTVLIEVFSPVREDYLAGS